MKKGMLFFVLIGFLFSCSNDDNGNASEVELIGSWKLIENLADPGDGSGTFQTVISEKIIIFNVDGTVISNGSLCDMSIQSNTTSSGTYSITESMINSSDCVSTELGIRFELTNSFLIVSYPCIEPCQSKYIKAE